MKKHLKRVRVYHAARRLVRRELAVRELTHLVNAGKEPMVRLNSASTRLEYARRDFCKLVMPGLTRKFVKRAKQILASQ